MGNKIMLNGAEMGKIVLNGVEYGGGSGISGVEIVADNKVINANGNFSYDVAELEAGYYLATFTSNLEKNSGLTEDHGNLITAFFYYDGTSILPVTIRFTSGGVGNVYGGFQISFSSTYYNILLTEWGGWQLTECKMNLAKVDPLVVEMYT